MRLLLQFVLAVCCICSVYGRGNVQLSEGLEDDKLERLVLLKKAHDLGLVDEKEFEGRKTKIMDEITGVSYAPQAANVTGNGTIFSPQVKFLLNQLVQGLPRSYQDILPTGENYWTTSIYLDVGAVDPYMNSVPLDSIIAVQERTLTRYGLNLYDGATWEIALALEGLYDIAALYEKNTLYTSGTGADVAVGGIINIRADDDTYEYGVNAILGSSLRPITLPGNSTRVIAHNGAPTSEISKKQAGAFFYRMIGPKYRMNDPLTGDYAASFKYPYPNNDATTPWNIGGVVHWNDWKPITGENVWGAIMGPIQALWIGNKSVITPFMTFDDAPGPIQLAISVLPALKALQSPLGSLYHCPKGTKMFPPDEDEKSNVSNENNFSGYASLKMLQEVLTAKTKGTNDVVLMQALMDVNSLVSGLESWFSKYLFSTPYKNYRVIFQGGHVTFDGKFNAVQIGADGGFAVDCQTWGLTVLGQKRVDSWYGNGTAYQVWQAVKEFSGYFDPSGKLGGVGYTIVTGTKHNLVWSAEWTWGAISMCEKLAYEYKLAGKNDWAQSLLDDAASMVKLIQTPMVRCKNSGWCGGGLMQEDGSYLYANSRFFIPWGWYANPIGATCSTAWSVMYAHKFNPFVLGGGEVSPLAL